MQEVNQLLKQYAQARKMMKTFSGGLLGKKLGKMKLPPFSVRSGYLTCPRTITEFPELMRV